MSVQKWKKRKEKAVEEGNSEQLFAACSELGELYTNREEFNNALLEYKEAKRAAKAANDTIKVALCHRMIGEVYSSMQNYDLALKHELKYLELARSKNDPVEEQRALANLGHIYFLKSETYANPDSSEKHDSLHKAKKYCSLSLQVCDRLSNISRKELIEMQARLHLNLGLILEQGNDIETAVGHLHKAINLCKSMDIWDILFRSYNALACLYQHENNNERSLQYFEKALSVAQRLPDKNQHICDTLLMKAEILFVLPDFRRAKQCLLKAYKLNTENRNDVERRLRTVAAVSLLEEKLLNTPEFDLTTVKSLYESLGDGCASMRSFSKALEYYHLMLETAIKMGESGEQLRPCYVSLSQTYKDNRQYDLALKYFKMELELNKDNPVESCKTTLSIGEVLEIKEADVEEIVSCYTQARDLAQAAQDHKLEARSLVSLIQVMTDRQRISEARRLENELEDLKEKFGPLPSSSESEDDGTEDFGADINIDELSDLEGDETNSSRTRKKCPSTKFRQNEKGEFPLHTACINGNLTLVKKLLDQGHPVNVRDHNGWLPLHEACNYGYVDIVRELLDHKALINDKGTEGCDGVTPLLDAASNGNLEVMQLLLDRGASPVMRTNKGETVLDCLVAWRKRYIKDEKRDLDPESVEQYNRLVTTLRSALTKAGHKPDNGPKQTSRSPSPDLSSQINIARRPSGSSFRNEKSSSSRHSSSSLRKSTEDDMEFLPKRSQCERDLMSKTSTTSSRRSSEFNGSSENLFYQKSSEATREYEDTMKALRRKPTTISHNPSQVVGRKALVQEEEVVDDWLEDDLGIASRGVKRRRTHQFDGEQLRRPFRLHSPEHSVTSEPSRRNTLRPVSPLADFGFEEQEMNIGSENEDLSELTELLSSNNQENDSTNPSNVSQPRRASTIKSSYQVPLSVFGVSRSPVPPPVVPPAPPSQQPTPTNSLAPVAVPAVSGIPFTQPPATSQIATPSIKVRVEGKLFLIPLPTTNLDALTVGWLADEAAKRYYSFEGVEPKLNITTEDGAMLTSQDPVTLLLAYREVVGVVSSWKQHPAAQRYKEVCAQLGVEADKYLEKCLEVSQMSFSLNLEGAVVDAVRAEPVFRAVHYQTELQHLILADNRLGDAGVQMLAKLVVKLPHLRELDLTCNGITADGLNILVQQVIEQQACKKLEILRLSHNRLGKTCVNLLSKLLFATKALTTLSLVSVGLTESSLLTSHRLHLESVEKLDVSHNSIGRDGVTSLLRELTVTRVTSLCLSHAGEGTVQVVAGWLSKGDPCHLNTLKMGYCRDQPDAFTLLIKSLERCPHLEHLELTFPEDISAETLEALYNLRLRVLRLPGTQVSKFPSVFPPVQELSCLSLAPPSWAYQAPFGFVTNNTRLSSQT